MELQEIIPLNPCSVGTSEENLGFRGCLKECEQSASVGQKECRAEIAP